MNNIYSKFSLALATFCLLISFSLKAQETTFTPSHLQATQEMLISMRVPNMITGWVSFRLNDVLRTLAVEMPTDRQEKVKKAVTTFFEKYGRWELLKNDIAKIYAAEFSEAEIKELTKFYRTPLGQKMLKKQPALMEKSSLTAQQAVLSHGEELMDIIKTASAQN